jgi:hypothetical protein
MARGWRGRVRQFSVRRFSQRISARWRRPPRGPEPAATEVDVGTLKRFGFWVPKNFSGTGRRSAVEPPPRPGKHPFGYRASSLPALTRVHGSPVCCYGAGQGHFA